MKQIESISVPTKVHEDGEKCFATLEFPSTQPSEIQPLPSEDRGFCFYVAIETIHEAAFRHKERVFKKMCQARLTAIEQGRDYIAKSECKNWLEIVSAGYAYESTNHIHFHKLKRDTTGNEVRIDTRYLSLPPVESLVLLVHAFYLRISEIPGRKRTSRLAHLRLLGSRHRGGMCLTELARFFNRTKQWASQMRKKLEKLGLCSFKARWQTSKVEDVMTEFILETEKFVLLRDGKRVKRRLTSLCTIHEAVCIRRRLVQQHGYAAAKGR